MLLIRLFNVSLLCCCGFAHFVVFVVVFTGLQCGFDIHWINCSAFTTSFTCLQRIFTDLHSVIFKVYLFAVCVFHSTFTACCAVCFLTQSSICSLISYNFLRLQVIFNCLQYSFSDFVLFVVCFRTLSSLCTGIFLQFVVFVVCFHLLEVWFYMFVVRFRTLSFLCRCFFTLLRDCYAFLHAFNNFW